MISLAVDRSLGTLVSFGPLLNVERLASSVSVSEGSSGSGAKVCLCELSLHQSHAVTCRQMACLSLVQEYTLSAYWAVCVGPKIVSVNPCLQRAYSTNKTHEQIAKCK